MRLHEFISTHRNDLIARTRVKVVARSAPYPVARAFDHGVPQFLEQLVEMLRPEAPSNELTDAIARSAALHGAELLELGLPIGQVVHAYGDICQAVTELAVDLKAPITLEEFHTLNRCLDDAIADAVTEYTRLRDLSQSDGETQRSGILTHEMRNRLNAASLAFELLTRGQLAINGSVAGVVTRNLKSLSALLDRSSLEVRLQLGTTYRTRIALRELVEESGADAVPEANARRVALTIAPTSPECHVYGDRPLLSGALANLLQNALKFTPAGRSVVVRSSATESRVLISVQDECGGLPPGKTEELFEAFQQRGSDRSGLGLGLFISRRAIEACGGTMTVQDLPASGCVFTIDLPRAEERSHVPDAP